MISQNINSSGKALDALGLNGKGCVSVSVVSLISGGTRTEAALRVEMTKK